MKWLVSSLVVALPAATAVAGGIDHKVPYDDSGIWNRQVQRGIEYATMAAIGGGALWLGGDNRLGRTYWESLDAGAIALFTGEVSKRIFGRPRPNEIDDPDLWFQGSSYHSFPSTEVSTMAGLVTPLVLQYGYEHPAVWGLEALPVIVGIGRVKVQAHWQTDVLAGFALGSASGYFVHRHDSPFILGAMPHGVQVGISKRF